MNRDSHHGPRKGTHAPNELLTDIEGKDAGHQAGMAQSAFVRLLEEAAQPRSASGNACVRLCGFVDQASKSKSQHIVAWAVSAATVEAFFNFYVEWNESDHHRSMKLVLDLIPQLIWRNPDSELASTISANLLHSLMAIITGKSIKPVAKSAIKTTEHLLVKAVFSADDIKQAYVDQHKELVEVSAIKVWNRLFADLFKWMRLSFVCPTAGRFVITLYRHLRHAQSKDGTDGSIDIDTWHQWLLDFLGDDTSYLEAIKNYIFLPLFKSDKPEALLFLQRMNEQPLTDLRTSDRLDTAALLRLAALESGKKAGFVQEPSLSKGESPVPSTYVILDEGVLDSVLGHPTYEVRSTALALLIVSPSTTRPYSFSTLELLKKHLPTYFAETDAKFRMDTVAKMRDMFKRVRGAIFVLKKSIPRAHAKAHKSGYGNKAIAQPPLYHTNLVQLPAAALEECLTYHQDFLKWYIHFQCRELVVTASYQRHVASLKTLVHILRMEANTAKTWETPDDQMMFYDLFDSTWARALLDLVMDPFDDIREFSAEALRWFLTDAKYRKFALGSLRAQASKNQDVTALQYRANKLSSKTSRADHSDGAARSCQLLYNSCDDEGQRQAFLTGLVEQLEQKIATAQRDLGVAVLDNPLHGPMASLCLTWQVVADKHFEPVELAAVRSLQDRLIACCEQVWVAVRDILCDDSPEGHLPMELEEVDGLDTKDLLSFSFRAVHEASNLMRTLALTVRNTSREGCIAPDKPSFERIGNLTFTQLASLRHRGAFTTVSSTFAVCCQQSKHVALPNGSNTLLKKWYEGTLKEIYSQRSTTRRSAGIPSLMIAILSATSDSPSFQEVMQTLMDIAGTDPPRTEEENTNLPQVHAYNCLKEIFKSSLLVAVGKDTETYLPQCLELAASGLKSEVWAIRNCGLILLRSLIDCLFGSHESKAMIEAGWDGKANRIHYHRYRNLPSVLLRLLQSGHQMMTVTTSTASAAESVFPALDIIRRAGPPDVLRQQLQRHITTYLSSPVWHVREMAARTLCSCLLHDHWLPEFSRIMQDALTASDKTFSNFFHGLLLTLRFVVMRRAVLFPDDLADDVHAIATMMNEKRAFQRLQDSPEVAAAYLEAINTIWLFQLGRGDTLASFQVETLPSVITALLGIQKVINDVIIAGTARGGLSKVHSILINSVNRESSLLAALQMLQRIYPPSTTSEQLDTLSQLYIDVCVNAKSGEVRVASLRNLTAVLDVVLSRKQTQLVDVHRVWELWQSLSAGPLDPSLSDAVIRISGSIMALLWGAGSLTPTQLRAWGAFIAVAGQDDKTFDTRMASAEALLSCLSTFEEGMISEDLLPALTALYDKLNDDDDDIRLVASKAASYPLGRFLVPLEAADSLINFLCRHFNHGSALLPMETVCRIIGQSSGGTMLSSASTAEHWQPAQEALAEAMRFDDSLFAVEEQNLFIDEVRETKRWLAAFKTVDWSQPEYREILQSLNTWVAEGLVYLTELIGQEDGPLGWASNPQVFAICSRILLAAKALQDTQLADTKLRAISTGFRERLGFAMEEHQISGLLISAFLE